MAKASKRKLEEVENPKVEEEEKGEEEEEEEEEDEQFENDDEEDGSDSDDSDDSDDDSDDEDSCPDVSDEEEDDNDSAEEDDDGKEINVEFSFDDPKEEDYLGLRTLLSNYHDGGIYDISGLVSSIIEQDLVGTVVKTAEDSDPIAVLTVLNTLNHKDKDFMSQTKDFLFSKCKTEYKDKIEKMFSEKGNGLLVSERLLNCHPKIAPPLVQFLFDEISNVVEDDDDDIDPATRDSFRFKNYLLISRVYTDPLGEESAAVATANNDKPKKKKQKKSDNTQAAAATTAAVEVEPVVVYVRPEDEYLHKLAEWSCVFPVDNRQVAKDELQPMRLVMVVGAEKVKEARKNLDRVVGNMASGGVGEVGGVFGEEEEVEKEEEKEEEKKEEMKAKGKKEMPKVETGKGKKEQGKSTLDGKGRKGKAGK
uniref:Protein BCCIP homolog n=1 Tax=Polytomella parva TaxID=51329 RepID=A0A7S0YF68_9CHLO